MDVFYETFLPAGIEPAEMVLVAGIFFIPARANGLRGIGLPAAAMAFQTPTIDPTTATSLMISSTAITTPAQVNPSDIKPPLQ